MRYLFHYDPKELREQVAPVGGNLAARGASVLIKNDGPAGVLFAFANDLWMMAANNSGAIDLRIERLPDDTPIAEPLWTSKLHGKPGRQAWHWEQAQTL